jgi:MATE family multidrug resistance protein
VATARHEAQGEFVLNEQPMNRLLSRHDSSRRFAKKTTTRADVIAQLKAMLVIAGPAILTNVANFGAGLTDAAFVGHLPLSACTLGGEPTQYLAGVGLANTFLGFIYFFANGLSFAMDTLVSQNYGAGNKERCSEILQTGVAVLTIAVWPVVVLHFFAADILNAVFSLDAVTMEIIRVFSRVMIFALPGALLYDCLAKWTSNQQCVMPSLVCSSVSLAFNAFMNWLLIYPCGLGFIGSPIATVLTRTVLPLLLLLWLKVRGHWKQMFLGFSKRAVSWQYIKAYVLCGMPAGGMILAEVGGFTGMTMMVAWLHSDVVMAAQVCSFQFLFILYFVPMGLSIATSARVGFLVGAGDPHSASLAAWTAQAFSMILSVVAAIIIIAGRTVLPYAFTSDDAVARLTGKLFFFVGAVHIGDAYQAVGLAVVRGIGRQNIGFALNMTAYYAVGLPLGAALAFGVPIGVFGVWTGMSSALSALASLVFLHNWTIDWQKEVDNAAAKTGRRPEAQIRGEDDGAAADGVPDVLAV